MLFWILVGVLVAGVTLAVTRPLTRSAGPPVNAADADIAVYKDQLKEVVADAARGSLAARKRTPQALRSRAVCCARRKQTPSRRLVNPADGVALQSPSTS